MRQSVSLSPVALIDTLSKSDLDRMISSMRDSGLTANSIRSYRNVFSVTPRRPKVKLVAKILKAIHAQASKKAAREKAKAVVEKLHSIKLK